jgi:hypothetical protein
MEIIMADYYTPTVIQQTIPNTDMTALERTLLSAIFTTERDGDARYFFAEDSPSDMIWIARAELETALAQSADIESSATDFVRKVLQEVPPEDAEIEIDLSATSYEFFLQDIVKRSAALSYITVVSAFTCSRMRADGFGGMAVLITATSIKGKSTHDIIEDFLAEEGLEGAQA